MTRPFPDGFDPATVPTYPVITITVHATGDDLYWVDVDDTPVNLGPDTDPTDPRQIAAAGIHHVSTDCTQRGWDGVRVKAIDADGHTWMMIVGPDDQAADLTAEPHTNATKPRQRWLIPTLIAGIVAALAAIAAIAWYILIPHDATPSTTQPTPTPAELPVPAPAGWKTHATWRVTERHQGIDALNTGTDIWSVSDHPDGATTLDQIDPTTGSIRASHALTSGGVTGLLSTRIDNHPAIAAITDTTVTYLDPAHPDTIHTLDAPPDHRIGATPQCIWTLGDHSLTLLTNHGFQPRTLPAASTPIGCHAGNIVTADSLGHIWHVGTAALTTTPQTLTPPDHNAQLNGIVAIHDGVILADWSTATGNAIAQWWNLTTHHQVGTASHSTTLPTTHDNPANTTTGRWSAAGPTVIDWTTHQLIDPPTDNATTDAIIADHWAWWSTDTTSTRIDLATGHTHTLHVAAAPAQPQFILNNHLGVIDHDSTHPGLYLLDKDTP